MVLLPISFIVELGILVIVVHPKFRHFILNVWILWDFQLPRGLSISEEYHCGFIFSLTI